MSVREIRDPQPTRAALLHAAAYERAAHRVFRVRQDCRGGVLRYDGLPRMGEPHPADANLVVHALLPRRVEGGWEVVCLYRPLAGERRVA